MHPRHELIAQGIAASLLRRVARVLLHGQESVSARVRVESARLLAAISPVAPQEPFDERAFFDAMRATYGEACGDELEHGPADTHVPTELEDLRRQLAEQQATIKKLLAAQAPQQQQQPA